MRVPRIRALTIEHGSHVVNDPLLKENLAAISAVKGNDGHSPVALARDAPVRALLDHVGNALFSPSWDPSDLLDRLKNAQAKSVVVQRDKPLWRGTEHDGIVTAPAVRIGVTERFRMKKDPRLAHVLDDDRICLEYLEAGEMFHAGVKPSVVIHRT